MKSPRKIESWKYITLIGICLVGILILYFTLGIKLTRLNKEKKLRNLNVILITLDTLRADYISIYKEGKAKTPNLDRIAKEGVIFEQCIAQSPLTLPSHTTILSGTYPTYHQVRDNGGFLVPGKLEFVSEILKEHGFQTSAFIGAYVLHSKWGINQGFDFYSDHFDLTKYKIISLGSVEKRAETVLKNAGEWIKEHKGRKFFTWIHLYDPHLPYDPPPPFNKKNKGDPYRGEVEYMDNELGKFFTFLKEIGIYNKSFIIITADHGESLWEHKEKAHGFYVYEQSVWVPLIIRAPFSFQVKKIDTIVEHVDVAPTILHALDIRVPGSYKGESLLGLLFEKNNRKKTTAYTETYYPRLHFGWSELKAFYVNKWKYIMAPHEELYNLGTDKGEKKNLNLKHSKIKTRLKKKLTKWVVEHSKDALSPGNIKNMSREDIAKIATLGYITSTVDTGKKRNLPDPKIKIDSYNEYLKTSRMMQEKKYDEVIEILKSIIKSNPDIVDVRLRLAINYSKKTMYREAVDIYLDILKQRPDCNEAMINLINALVDLGEFDSALEEVDKFIKMFPNDPILYGKKGLLYYYKKDYDNALKFFKKSVDIEGTNPQSLDKIGEIYIIKEEYETAESYIHRAISINPKLKSAHYHLGQLEDARKNPGKANRYYRKELDIDPENFKAAYNLAGNLKRMGHIEEAVKFYRQTIKHNPGFKMAYFMIAQYFLEKGENQKEAIELCKKGLTIMPKDRETMFGYYILTNIYGGIGDKANFDYYTREGNRLFESLNKNADK